ncbi:MAG: adenylate/guanylate cyclase domain-containing protein [Burkholderiales bacterium]|nr:adenylate/guanylate cyclase domain-containing protein [Burkholderiales bacterium]
MTLISQQRTILFADVAGSTAIYEALGDKPAAKAIESCLDALQAVAERCGGRVVKRIGDEIMAVFGCAEQGFEAARSMQRQVSGAPPAGGVPLAIRIGFHHGPVLEDKGDFWGDTVNTAARLAGLAKSRQIYTSGATAGELPARLQAELRDLAALSVKGKQDALPVFELMWEDGGDATQLAGVPAATAAQARLRLHLAARTLEYPAERNSFVLGRDTGCDLVVTEKTASRRHARIERRGAQFFLVDESTNGTYLHVDGDREVLLRRDQALLRGRGKIGFGISCTSAGAVLGFECE